jgi:ataxia telangiectasia mutated family protein
LLLQRQCELDQQESGKIEEDRATFLQDAITNYLDCLKSGDKYDIRVMFRLCSLWFNNSGNQKVNKILKAKAKAIPSRKFLPLIYQIASRMSASDTSPFQEVLSSIIQQAVVDHPYHSLYQIYALGNGDQVQSDQKGKSKFVVDQDKINAARSKLQVFYFLTLQK